MKLIPLSVTGKKYKDQYFAKVDDEDYDRLIGYKWFVSKCRGLLYAKCPIGNNVWLYLHREIMQAKKGQIVDHKDRDLH